MRGWTSRRVTIGAAAALLSVGYAGGDPTPALAQERGTVRGTVLAAEDMRPIEGASVALQGTEIGTLTGANGEFMLRDVASGERTLIVRFIGYSPATRTVTITAGQTTEAEFVLSRSAIQLRDIVVTGTGGRVERRKVGNSILSVTTENVTSAVSNVSSVLASEAPAVRIEAGSGAVGAGSKIRLRGLSSITQLNEPIIYIDGIRLDNSATDVDHNFSPARLDDINPEDIERIEVLKGPAASTLLGSEAAPGVIQIFTKKGRSGETRANLSVSVGFEDMVDDLIPINGNVDPSTGELLTNDPIRRELLRTGIHQQYAGNVSGGFSDNAFFYLSAKWEDRVGAVRQNQLMRFNGRANLSFPIGDKVNVDAGFSYIDNDLQVLDTRFSSTGAFGAGLISNPANVRPGFPFGETFTSVDAALQSESTQDVFRTLANVTTRFTPVAGVSLVGTVGIDQLTERNTIQFPFGVPFRGLTTGQRLVAERQKRTITVDGRVNWEHDLSDGLSSSFVVGLQGFVELEDRTGGEVRTFPGPGLQSLGTAKDILSLDESSFREVNGGVFVQEQLSINDRLHLTAGLRADGSSSFGSAGFDPEFLPKGSVSYELSEEPFWSGGGLADVFSSVRLRGAIGWASQNPGPFDAQRTFRAKTGQNNDVGVTPGRVGNRELTAERAREIEGGLDLGMIDERVAVSFTYFHKQTNSALLAAPFPPSVGFFPTTVAPGSEVFNEVLRNIGQLESKGFELEVRSQLLREDPLRWDLNVSFENVDNEVTDLGGLSPFSVSRLTATQWFIREGFTPGAIFAPVLDPADPFRTTVPIDEVTSLSQVLPNVLTAANGADSLVFLGNPIPDYRIKFGNTFRILGNLEARVTGTANFGDDYVMVNTTEAFRGILGSQIDLARIEAELRDPSTSAARREELALRGARTKPQPSGNWVQDSDFLRIQEIAATYQFPQSILERLGTIRSLSITATVREPFLFTGYPGPAFPGTSFTGRTPVEPGFLQNADFFQVPFSTRVMFALRVGL